MPRFLGRQVKPQHRSGSDDHIARCHLVYTVRPLKYSGTSTTLKFLGRNSPAKYHLADKVIPLRCNNLAKKF